MKRSNQGETTPRSSGHCWPTGRSLYPRALCCRDLLQRGSHATTQKLCCKCRVIGFEDTPRAELWAAVRGTPSSAYECIFHWTPAFFYEIAHCATKGNTSWAPSAYETHLRQQPLIGTGRVARPRLKLSSPKRFKWANANQKPPDLQVRAILVGLPPSNPGSPPCPAAGGQIYKNCHAMASRGLGVATPWQASCATTRNAS